MAKKVKKRLTPKQRLINFRKGIAKATEPVMQKHVELRDLATEGWSARNKPKIVKKTLYITAPTKSMTWQVILYAPPARGSTAGHSVYRMIGDKRTGNMATIVRRAYMGPNYDPKTIPNRFGQFGAGGLPFHVSKFYRYDGIRARNWEEMIAQFLNPDFEAALQKGGASGLRE